MTLVTVVDKDDKVVGEKEFSDLSEMDITRLVVCHIQNSDGEVLLIQRAFKAEKWAAKWSLACVEMLSGGGDYMDFLSDHLSKNLGIDIVADDVEVVSHHLMSDSVFVMMCRIVVDVDVENIAFDLQTIKSAGFVEKDVLLEDVPNSRSRYVPDMDFYCEELLG